MPSANIDDVLATKPVTFKLKTSGGLWKCQIHPTRAAYEKARVVTPVAPGITRTDSGLSTTSTSSASSTRSSH